MLETIAWAVMFMCLGGAIVVIVGVAILMISSDQ
jgi:predicted permease